MLAVVSPKSILSPIKKILPLLSISSCGDESVAAEGSGSDESVAANSSGGNESVAANRLP